MQTRLLAGLNVEVWNEYERERICAAIKAEDDYCVTEGDYMLDSDDCIAVARGTWKRPDYDLPSNAEVNRNER